MTNPNMIAISWSIILKKYEYDIVQCTGSGISAYSLKTLHYPGNVPWTPQTKLTFPRERMLT